MNIPPPPTIPPVPKPPLFPMAAEKQSNKKLGDDLRALCQDLCKATYTPGWQEAFLKYRDAVTPRGASDMGRLPYSTTGPNYPVIGNPYGCLLAKLAWAIRLYWAQCDHGEDRAEEISRFILDICRVIEYDIHLETTLNKCAHFRDGCRIIGNTQNGYWLEVPSNG